MIPNTQKRDLMGVPSIRHFAGTGTSQSRRFLSGNQIDAPKGLLDWLKTTAWPC
jgi:hypothetical protein